MGGEQLALLKEIMKLEFALVETALYLDTHPRDARMLAEHNKYACQLEMLKKQYEQKYGPLTNQGMSRCPWRYIDEPWPWEIQY
ncbi:MAG: spore coat protein CotJB [Firmicutes bacterium]|nr:spore coat protein CotJB [Bacillota bacterium]